MSVLAAVEAGKPRKLHSDDEDVVCWAWTDRECNAILRDGIRTKLPVYVLFSLPRAPPPPFATISIIVRCGGNWRRVVCCCLQNTVT
jgi:hypothetical protein